MFDFETIANLSYILGGICLLFFFYKKDELALLMWVLYATNGLYRYFVVVINPNHYATGWVRVAWARDIFTAVDTDELGLTALNYFLLGTACWTGAYMLMRLYLGKPKKHIDEKPFLDSFINRKRTLILSIYSFILLVSYFFILNVTSSFKEGEYNVDATGLSYFLYLPFALGGVIILMFLVYRSVLVGNDPVGKLGFMGLIGLAAIQSYNPGARFNFISWSVVVIMILVQNISIWRRAFIYFFGGAFAIMTFSIAGLVRTPNAWQLTFEEKVNVATERLLMAEDQNLLDGFLMVLQVYPDNLPFQYGYQHLEILLRPIPRAIWKDKPKGGYANKLGLNDIEGFNGATIGISESIYGTFYGEGGVAGIVILSILYGSILAYIVYRAERFKSDMQFVYKGLVVGCCIALIRGGDLAGIAAFICMSYWPIFIANYQYGGYLKRLRGWFAEMERTRQLSRLAQVLEKEKEV
jgi:hypothetical protein